jgi:hypothetical protein
MGLVTTQSEFAQHVSRLLQRCAETGFTVTLGEVFRTLEQQKIYLKTGRSKTLNSQHMKRLAIDLNFFRNGELVQNRADIKPIGDWWEALHPKNRWGGNWRGLVDSGRSHFIDCPHFERQE